MSPYQKEHRSNPAITERFELNGKPEGIGHGLFELNDPIDQREGFEDQLQPFRKGDDEAMFIRHRIS